MFSVEDPSENFQRLRDFVDVKNCLKLPSFQKESVQRGFCDGLAKEAQDKLKLTKVWRRSWKLLFTGLSQSKGLCFVQFCMYLYPFSFVSTAIPDQE